MPSISNDEKGMFEALRQLHGDVKDLKIMMAKRLQDQPLTGENPCWMPSASGEESYEIRPPRPKIIALRAADTEGLYGLWGRVAASKLGGFCRRHLRGYPFIRKTAIWVWGNVVAPIYQMLTGRRSKIKRVSWYKLTKFSQFTEADGALHHKLLDEARIEPPAPTVFPAHDKGLLVPLDEYYVFPEVAVKQVCDGTICSESNLVIKGKVVICHDLYDFQRDYTSEELHGRHKIKPKTGHIRYLLADSVPASIAQAACFVDACSTNYAHWLSEVLPRVAAFCSDERFKDIPIVVDQHLHRNIFESLFYVAGADREVIILPRGRALRADKLYLTSVAGYVPFGKRNHRLNDHSHGLFSPQALKLLRSFFFDLTDKYPAPKDWPEKIFLRRSTIARSIINAAEVEELMVSRGYAIVQPEKLPFLQQVRLFRNAKEIISPTGAALANGIFCSPGARLGVMMAKHQDMIYGYWANMLSPLQVDVQYVLGEICGDSSLGIHSPYSVNPLDVADLLDHGRQSNECHTSNRTCG